MVGSRAFQQYITTLGNYNGVHTARVHTSCVCISCNEMGAPVVFGGNRESQVMYPVLSN